MPMTGRMMLNMPHMQEFFSLGFGSEIIYSFVIIACSLMVYFSTKEMYELSSYKGIKYFRMAFLFFAIAFFFHSFVKFLLMFFHIPRSFAFSLYFIGTATLFFFIYASTMAIFYLLYSLIWKKWKFKIDGIVFFHFLAVIISFVSVFSNKILLILLLQVILFFFVAVLGYLAHNKNKKKKNQIYFVYLLLFAFWILNIIDILVPDFFVLSKLLIYLVSLGLFLYITYKVLRAIGAK